MKADITLCASTFSMATLPVFISCWSRSLLSRFERTKPTSTDCVFLMKQRFMFEEQSTGIDVVYREVKTLMTLVNVSVIHNKVNVW
jgi:hypothetical protein